MNPSTNSCTNPIQRRAQQRVAMKSSVIVHALVFTLVHAGLYLMSVLGAWDHRPAPQLPIWGWALGLAIHASVVFVGLQGEGLRRHMLKREIATLERSQGR